MIPLLIYVCVPLAGIALYVVARRRMIAAVPQPRPEVGLFLVFACYGSLVLVLLTGLFWQWSGMASLGTVVLLTAGFPALLARAWLRDHRQASVFHERIRWASIGFVPALLLVTAVLALRFRG